MSNATTLLDEPIGINTMMLDGVDTSKGPIFSVSDMAGFFFNRTSHWVRWLEANGRLVLDGVPIECPRTPTNARQYDLATIEKIAHALASNSTITVLQLRQALLLIKVQAEMHGVMEETYSRPAVTKTEEPREDV